VDPSDPVLPLQRPAPSRRERRFSTLTAAQIARITAHGRRRAVARGEVLVEVEDKTVPIFVVIGGDVQALRPAAGAGTLIVTFVPGQFSGEGNMLDRDPVALRARESTLTG
jgi:CRP-like cAMP-binding protein